MLGVGVHPRAKCPTLGTAWPDATRVLRSSGREEAFVPLRATAQPHTDCRAGAHRDGLLWRGTPQRIEAMHIARRHGCYGVRSNMRRTRSVASCSPWLAWKCLRTRKVGACENKSSINSPESFLMHRLEISSFLIGVTESRPIGAFSSIFACLATIVSRATAVTDVTLFRTLAKARNDLAHGEVEDTDRLPASDCIELLRRYVALVASADYR